MNIDELLALILSDSKRISDAISFGAMWEVWMQIELATLLREAGMQVAREIHYPPPFKELSVDLLASKDGVAYAIELKCETGGKTRKAASRLLKDIETDVAKIKNFSTGSSEKRWVVGIAYTVPSKAKLNEYALVNSKAAVYGESSSVGVIVINADKM